MEIIFKFVSIPSRLYGDGRRLKQVLINLIKNVLKFTRNGNILIRVSFKKKPDNMLVVQVSEPSWQGSSDYEFAFMKEIVM